MLPLLRRQQLTERIEKIKESKKTWSQVAIGLYQILDDIGTVSDWCKGNSKTFMESVLHICSRRNQYLTSNDGRTIERVDEDLQKSEPVEVPLTNSKAKALVDAEDAEKVLQHTWFLKTDPRTNVHYVARSVKVNGKVKTIRLHRFVMSAGSDADVHHKDTNPLNCQKDNLEVVPRDIHRSYHTKRHRQRVPAMAATESIKECVCHIYEMDNDELFRFYRDMPKSYIGPDGKHFNTYGEDKVTVESEIKKRGMTLPVLEDEVKVKNPEDRFGEWIRTYDWTLGHVNLGMIAEKFGLDEKDVLRIAQEYGLTTRGSPYEGDIIIYAPPSQVDSETGRFIQKQLPSANESKMSDWARNELQMAGLFDKESDYEGMLGEAVMELMDKFSEQGHSGFSAELTASIFDRLVHWKPLSELTSDPEEWNEIEEEQSSHFPGHDGKVKVFQSRRSPDCFSEDGGQTYYSIDDSCFEGTEDNGVTFMRYCPETWAKVTIHTAKKKE